MSDRPNNPTLPRIRNPRRLPDPATDIAGGWITLADLRERMAWPAAGPELVSLVRALQAAQHVECRGGWERTFIVRKKA